MSEIFHHPVSIQGTAYFASDFHFGAPTPSISKERERLVVAWLDEIKKDADYLFLLGDIFDFWFEYKDVVPRGYFRFFAKLQELNEQGIIIYYFTGNHDMWVKNYLANELGVKVFYAQQSFLINGKKCMVGHGDGLDTKDKGYLLIKKIFVFRPNQLLYGALHPRWAFAIARFFSKSSRTANQKKTDNFKSSRKESIIPFVQQTAKNENIDYFIYGHRHVPQELLVGNNSTYYNTGDWLIHNSYLQWTPDAISLKYYSNK